MCRYHTHTSYTYMHTYTYHTHRYAPHTYLLHTLCPILESCSEKDEEPQINIRESGRVFWNFGRSAFLGSQCRRVTWRLPREVEDGGVVLRVLDRAQLPAQVGPPQAHPFPPEDAAHILKSLLQSQADVGLDAGPFLPLPAKHFAESGVGAGSAC